MFTLRRFCVGAALGLSLLACRPAYAQTNLIQNPGFETTASNFAPWQVSGGAAILSSASAYVPAHGGVHLAALSRWTNYTGGPPHGWGTVFQPVHFSHTGVPYRLAGFVWPGAGAAATTMSRWGTLFLGGLATTTSHGYVTDWAFSQRLQPADGYRSFGGTITPVATHGQIFLAGALASKTTGGITHNYTQWGVAIDDVSLTRKSVGAPEVDPRAGAPALALALGGLALMMDRRRRPIRSL